MEKLKIQRPEQERYLKLLVYGAYGVGKTYLAATAVQSAKLRDVLFLDFEAGTQTLARPQFREIDVISIRDFPEFSQIYEFLRQHCQLRDSDPQKLRALNTRMGVRPDRKYRTVVMDSMTEIHKLALYRILSIDPDRTPIDADLPVPELRDWSRAAEALRLLVRAMRNLPAHVIIICAEQTMQDDTGRIYRMPALAGKLTAEIQGIVDVVAYMKASVDREGKVRRRVYLAPVGPFAAKDRLHPNGVVHVDEPTIGRLLGLPRKEVENAAKKEA